MNEIQQLTQLINQFREERDWKQFHKPKDMVISLMLEASEVAELFQWKTEEEMEAMRTPQGNEDLADELSDVLAYLLQIAHDHNIDLKEAFLRKMEKSAKKYPIEKARGNKKKYTEY